MCSTRERSTSSAEVHDLTQGRGVDVVLNSLAGEFIGASVRCLTPRGPLPRDRQARHLECRALRASPAAGPLSRDRSRGDAHSGSVWARPRCSTRVLQRIERGELRPLPVQTFPLERAVDAFRFMAMARHVGKVVLTQQDHEAASLRSLDPRAAYLITGGLSGLGLLTAQRLVERGARHLLLVGRARRDRRGARHALPRCALPVCRCSRCRPMSLGIEDVRRVLAAVPAATPLRGIVHSAGLLEDGALLQQQWERFVRPLGPKVDGSWALHVLTRQMRLDFFVMYSSIASVLGSSGQGNHAAANAFMDALAAWRRSRGPAGRLDRVGRLERGRRGCRPTDRPAHRRARPRAHHPEREVSTGSTRQPAPAGRQVAVCPVPLVTVPGAAAGGLADVREPARV